MSIKTNPDTNYANEMLRRIKDNDGYCPCSIEKTPDTRCMCKEFREIDAGICHCGLYIKDID